MTTSIWKNVFTYEACKATFARRKKGSTTKAVMRGSQLRYDEAKDEYIVSLAYYRNDPIDLASVNKDNIATVLSTGDTISHRNRLSAIFKWEVYSDLSNHRTNVNHVRMRTKKYKWHNPSGDKWERVLCATMPGVPFHLENIPCNAGTQFLMTDEGDVKDVINYKGDFKKLVTKKAIVDARQSLAKVRKVVMVMLKMGSFDDAIKTAMTRSYVKWDESAIERIIAMPNDVTGYEAEQAIQYALCNMNIPWRIITLEDLRPKVFETAMKLLRETYYLTVDGCYEYVEASCMTRS